MLSAPPLIKVDPFMGAGALSRDSTLGACTRAALDKSSAEKPFFWSGSIVATAPASRRGDHSICSFPFEFNSQLHRLRLFSLAKAKAFLLWAATSMGL